MEKSTDQGIVEDGNADHLGCLFIFFWAKELEKGKLGSGARNLRMKRRANLSGGASCIQRAVTRGVFSCFLCRVEVRVGTEGAGTYKFLGWCRES